MNSAVRALRLPFVRRALSACVACALGAALALSVASCTPNIGDKCILSTDCSVAGTLVCDTSQLDGYCTQLNCARLSCPSNTTCVMFYASVPGCAYDDYRSPSRTGRTFCMENCSQDSDCRAGYLCRDPSSAPWNAAILDDNQSQGVCISNAAGSQPDAAPNENAAVCQPYVADGGRGVDATDAATPDADGEGGSRGSGDSAADSVNEGSVDSSSTDAFSGG